MSIQARWVSVVRGVAPIDRLVRRTVGPFGRQVARLVDESPERSGPTADPTLADLVAGMPEVWRRLLAAHQPDRLGRCAACRTSSGPGERWPCSLQRIAQEAERRYGLRLGQAIGSE